MVQSTQSTTAVEFFGGDELRLRVFLDKYALRDLEGQVVEQTPEEMWKRLAREIASVEATKAAQKAWREKFHWLLKDFKFIPGGRIMFAAGQPRRATLLNCYVIPIQEDSLEGIFEWCKQAARTYSLGGGVGTDISILRPKGAPVNNSALYSTGSVSFMDLLSMTTGTIGQAGRRGALMITIAVDHPDVDDFIEVKNDPERQKVKYANISVRLTDKFMEAVQQNKAFTLRYENDIIGTVERIVDARKLWDKLIHNAWASAEPGLIFWDTIKRESTTEYNGMEVITTNPCSEIPLEPYGCCCLGNINLAKFVKNPFEPDAKLDWLNLEQALRYATRFLDNVLDYNADKHPLPEQRKASLWSRRIGVGFTGFGDMLIKLGLKYDTDEAIEFTDKLFERIKHIVYEESVNLAQEKGAFPAFDLEQHLKSPFVQRLDKQLLSRIQEHGLRNAALLTVPPVGSGSALAGCSSGIEPIFALKYVRKSKSLSKDEFDVYHPLVREYLRSFNLRSEQELPPTFVTAHEIAPEFRVRMQATIQKHIDHAISSTVNLPEEITPEEVAKIYFLGWKLGCKGITVYREGSREGILLTERKAKQLQPRLKPQRSFKALTGSTYKFKTEVGSMFVIVNHDPDLLAVKDDSIAEVFIEVGKSGSAVKALTEGLGRSISAGLQSGIAASVYLDQLRQIKSRPTVQPDGQVIQSLCDAVGVALEAELGSKIPVVAEGARGNSASYNGYKADLCPSCGGALQFTNGCYVCSDCGFSECG